MDIMLSSIVFLEGMYWSHRNFAKKKKKNNKKKTIAVYRYHDQHLAQNVGSVLQEMAKRQELAPMLLNQIRITRKKIDKPKDKGDEKETVKDQSSKPGIIILIY